MKVNILLIACSFFIINTQAQKIIKPYLQTPTSTSIYICWLSLDTTNTIVQYGISQDLDSIAIGNHENISGKIWHTVKLINLTPNTTYYYRCISGIDSSVITPFHTAPNVGTSGGHIRFGLLSDSQDNYKIKTVVDNMKQTCINLYGQNWYDSISFIQHNGDIVSDGSILSQFETQFFNPYNSLSESVPFMLSLGNHEVSASGSRPDSSNVFYYKFMKYEDFSPYQYPNVLAERYYSFILGNSLFITLNANTGYTNTTQSTWLENKLIAAQSDSLIDFVFVNVHHPGKDEIWEWGYNNYVQNTIYGILKKYSKIALVTHGHEHAYESGIIKSTNSDNVDFRTIICGGGGGYLEDWFKSPKCVDLPYVQKSLTYWHYLIIDVDMDSKSYTAKMYSLGNGYKSLDNVLFDTFYRRINQPAPDQPKTIFPIDSSDTKPLLIASGFSGVDTIMSSQFQVTATPGNYAVLLVDITRDFENIFKDSGPPNYTPININKGIDLYRFQTTTSLTLGNTYSWRVRYRDKNLKWSAWSDDATFTALTVGINEQTTIKTKVSIYPNPTRDTMTLEFYLNESGKVTVEIYNESGVLIKTVLNTICTKGLQKIILDYKFSPGIYFCKIKSNEIYNYERIIIQ